MDIKCDDCKNTYNIRYCLRCHKSQCFRCQPLHCQRFSDHIFVFPVPQESYYTTPRCKIHFNKLTSFCRDCKNLFCDTCEGFIHCSHNAASIGKVKDEQTEKRKKEKTFIDEHIKKIIYGISKRETLLKNFRTELTTIINYLPIGSRYSLGETINDVESYVRWNEIECNPPPKLKVLLNQLQQLRGAKYYYQEIQNALNKILETFRDDKCILLSHQYQCAIEKYCKNPPTSEEAPELLNIYQEKTIDKETMSPLFRIYIG